MPQTSWTRYYINAVHLTVSLYTKRLGVIVSYNVIVVMDETQVRGMSAEYVAQRILNAIACRDNEVLVAPLVHRIAVYLRNILPDFYFQIMQARAKKQCKEKSKTQ